jgi:class 3 adenylate cyclase
MAVWQPRTSFCFTPDGARIAYQVVGSGERDIVFLTDWSHSIDLMWEQPRIEHFLRRLASLGRLILFDKRGNGASDGRAFGTADAHFKGVVEQSAEDLLAVLDEVQSGRADIVATTAGGTTALLFAATHPERCGRLVLQDACPRVVSSSDYPFGLDEAALSVVIDGIRTGWGKGATMWLQPDLFDDRDLRLWYGRYERLSIERSSILSAWEQMAEFDVRPVLSSVQAPTLLLAHDKAPGFGNGHGRYLEQHLPSAKLVELDGPGCLFWADETVAEAAVNFLGATPRVIADENRVLATVVMTDMVSSTMTLAELGDSRWREVLDAHDQLTGQLVTDFRGRLINRTGDGLVATFDGPARGVRCADAICQEVGGIGIDVRAGVHVGEIELRGVEIGGIAVHLAARVMSTAGAGEVVVTRTVKDLTAGSGLHFEDRGVHELKGIPEAWQLLALTH